MDRPLVVGSASGLISSLALSLLRDLATEGPKLESLGRCLEVVPELGLEEKGWIFLCGLLAGLAIWPVVDLLWLVREQWRRFVWRQVAATSSPSSSRPLYKVIA